MPAEVLSACRTSARKESLRSEAGHLPTGVPVAQTVIFAIGTPWLVGGNNTAAGSTPTAWPIKDLRPFLRIPGTNSPPKSSLSMGFAIDIYGQTHTMRLFSILPPSQFLKERDNAPSTIRTSHAG